MQLVGLLDPTLLFVLQTLGIVVFKAYQDQQHSLGRVCRRHGLVFPITRFSLEMLKTVCHEMSMSHESHFNCHEFICVLSFESACRLSSGPCFSLLVSKPLGVPKKSFG